MLVSAGVNAPRCPYLYASGPIRLEFATGPVTDSFQLQFY